MKKLFKVLLGVFICIQLGCFGMIVDAKGNDTILKGICIDEIDVSGMTAAQAKETIEFLVEERLETPITLYCVNDNEVVITPSQLGMVWTNPEIIQEAVNVGRVGNVIERYKIKKNLERENYVLKTTYSIDKTLIDEIIDTKCIDFDQEAMDLALQRVNGEFLIVEGQQGLQLDADAAKTMVYDFVLNQWDGKEASLNLPVIVEEPKGSAAELQKVKDVLGSYTTYYTTSSAARVANVENGTRLINGVTLYPGETFSMLDLVTPFTEANGYHMAGSYLNGLVVDSLGGGICQVSTTLYNAVLRAELEISERSSHSMSVAYVPLSADAAIAESAGKDFCFTNNTDHPIYVEGITTPQRQVTFNIYGAETRAAGHSVDYVSEVLETIQPTTENIIQDAAQPVGYTKIQSAHVGYKAQLVKITYENGIESSREVINKSTYKMVPRTATVGIATGNPDAYNQLQAAIATGSIDHVCAIAGAIAAQNAPPAPAEEVPAIGTEIVPDI